MSGLRGRLLLALVVTSLATLGAAAFVAFSPLERRVVADRRDELRDLARAVRPVLRELPERDRRAGAPELLRIVARLQARTGGRILLYDRGDRKLADTSSLGDEADLDPPATLRARAETRRDGVYTGERGDLVFAATEAGTPELLLVVTARLDDGRAAAAVLRAAAPPALGVGVGVALILGLLVSRRLSRRLETLRSDADALGSEGLTHPVSVSGRDEVTVVARALERMRTQLIDEQSARQDFLATASHELRTPLASMQAGLELLREELDRGTADHDAVVEHADRALRQTSRLTGLATDLLDLSRIDGGVALRADPIELRELAALVVGEFAARMAIAGRTLELDGDDAALVYADPTATARIIRILLDNAGHYGAGPVAVSVAAHDRRVTLTVTDEGEGIGDDERDAVFQRFSRGRAGAGSSAGAGLGLPIARGLARAMGGELEAVPARKGARLVLTLPAA